MGSLGSEDIGTVTLGRDFTVFFENEISEAPGKVEKVLLPWDFSWVKVEGDLFLWGAEVLHLREARAEIDPSVHGEMTKEIAELFSSLKSFVELV